MTWMHLRNFFALVASLALAACVSAPSTSISTATRPLRLASWNLEFLAEHDGQGCEPRTPRDYEAMRRIIDALDADIIAFQEAENAAAAARVFDPARYTIVMEARPGRASGNCGGRNSQQAFIRQADGFAVRKGIAFERKPDVTSLMLGNPQLRSGVDIIARPRGHAPIRLLAIHLKSGCFDDASTNNACPVLRQQVPALEAWIDEAAAGPIRFAVMGDWNRRLAEGSDNVWRELADGQPRNAELRLADQGVPPSCDPRFKSFIDHIALDRRAGQSMHSFREIRYVVGQKHYSDHCPIEVALAN